jgi:hypothetical protein
VCVCVCEYYHDSPPLIIAHLKPEAPALARVFYTRIIRRGLIDLPELAALTWCCLRLVSLQVLSAPYLKNNGHHQVPHLKVGASTSVTVQVCMLHARLLSFSLWWIMVLAELNQLFKCADGFICVRAFRFRAQVLTSPRTTAMPARYHSRAGGCAWSRYPARSR